MLRTIFTHMNAIVTGATHGIGKAIATALAQKGYSLWLCSRKFQELENLKIELEQVYSVPVQVFAADLSKATSVKELVNWLLNQEIRVDVLVNNAGLYIEKTILQESDQDYEDMFGVNVRAPYLLCKYLHPRFNKNAYIFNVSSLAGAQPIHWAPTYSVSKMALIGLSKVLRQEFKADGIRVSSILPGAVFTRSWSETELKKESFVVPEDVGKMVLAALEIGSSAVIEEITIAPRLLE